MAYVSAHPQVCAQCVPSSARHDHSTPFLISSDPDTKSRQESGFWTTRTQQHPTGQQVLRETLAGPADPTDQTLRKDPDFPDIFPDIFPPWSAHIRKRAGPLPSQAHDSRQELPPGPSKPPAP